MAFAKGRKRLASDRRLHSAVIDGGRRWWELQVTQRKGCGPFMLTLPPSDHPSWPVQPALYALSSIWFLSDVDIWYTKWLIFYCYINPILVGLHHPWELCLASATFQLSEYLSTEVGIRVGKINTRSPGSCLVHGPHWTWPIVPVGSGLPRFQHLKSGTLGDPSILGNLSKMVTVHY